MLAKIQLLSQEATLYKVLGINTSISKSSTRHVCLQIRSFLTELAFSSSTNWLSMNHLLAFRKTHKIVATEHAQSDHVII